MTRLIAVPLVVTALLVAGCSRGSSDPGTAAPTANATSSTMSQAMKYAACMRSHGISDFPDPNSQGGFALTVGPGSDLSSSDPKFVTAETACESLMPSEGSQAQQEEDYAAELKYAHCMQSRGVNVPDPKAPGSGADTGSNSGNSGATGNSDGVNPDSPQYIAANKACQHYLPAGNGPSTSNGGQS